jgi:lactate dehydrogenase-like 2-hydroxyacid dehydrogenase
MARLRPVAREERMKPDVLVVWPNRPKAMETLAASYRLHHLWQAEDCEALLATAAAGVRAIVTTGERGASAELIDRLPRLEIVACFGVGIDAIDREACRRRNVMVTNTPDVLTEDVADMGLALMLATLRGIVFGDRWVREGRWQREGQAPLTTCARGKRLGVLGLGRIGLALAKRAQVLGMTVGYCNRRRRDDVDLAYFAGIEALAAWCDVLVLCAPGGEATRGLVDKAVLEALGPRGYLVNIARGSVVDEAALVTALTTGGIAGAGLDVFADEPRVPEALLGLDHVVLQPHAASATTETRDAMADLVVANLAAHFAGRPLLTPVA